MENRRPSPPEAGLKAFGLPRNAKSVSQSSLDELKKTAASRGIPVETLIAQMVQQYLAEDKLKK